MGVIARGIRNAFRNSVRTVSIVIILGLSVGLALSMLVARQAVNSKIASVKSSIGNTITVSPAGARGFTGGGNPLTAANVATIKQTTHVASATATLTDRLTTAGQATPSFGGAATNSNATTNLTSPVSPGTLGRRFGGGNGGATTNANFTLPIGVTGTTNPTSTQVASANQLKIISGSTIDGNGTANVALVGKDLASKNNLTVGSTFTGYGQTIKVSGIYDAGNTFTNAGIIMPLGTVQNLSAQTGDVTSVIVQVDSISNLEPVTNALKSALGSAADVVSQQDSSSQALAPLENIKNISLISLVGAIVAGAVIILLTMLMIVRERRREIGVLKAIGSSNLKIMVQFMTEAVTLTLAGAVIGLGIGVVGSSPVTKLLVNNANPANSAGGPGAGGFGGGIGRGAGGALRLAGQSGASLRNVQAAVGWNILLYGLAAAIVIAIVGSALPALLISRVRPAEVMRAE